MPMIHITSEALAIVRLRTREPVRCEPLGDGTFTINVAEEELAFIKGIAFDGETASDVIVRLEGVRHGYN